MKKHALSELRTELTGDPDAIRSRVVDLVCETAEASLGLWYVFGLVGGDPYPVRWRVREVPEALLTIQSAEAIPWPSGDPRLPDARWRGRFVSMRSIMTLDELAPTRLYRICYEPHRVVDQVRMMVYHQGRHVAWIGALRRQDEGPFDRRARRRLRAIAAPITDALVHADAAERARGVCEGADLVLDAAGGVELASSQAASILAHPEREAMLRAWVRSADRGEEPPRVLDGFAVRWSRLYGAGGVRYLLHLERTGEVRLHEAFVLSRTQRRVARLAAAGAQVREIAEQIGVTPATVRTHLRQVYRVLEVGNRAELARALEGMPDRPSEAG